MAPAAPTTHDENDAHATLTSDAPALHPLLGALLPLHTLILPNHLPLSLLLILAVVFIVHDSITILFYS